MEKITVGHFLRGRPSSALTPAQSSVQSWPMPSVSSGRCQAGHSASLSPHINLSHSRTETVTHPTLYGARYPPKPIPFLCSSPCYPPVKFWPRPTPRCSIQASVSCPSHCRRGVASSYCVGRCLSSPLNRRDAGANHPTTMPHAAPLLPPSLLTPHASHLASSSLATRPVGTMRGHTHARHYHYDVVAVPCCARMHSHHSATVSSRHLPHSLLV
jgi:hypothetical protein